MSGRTDAEANERSKRTGSRDRQKRVREEMEDTSMTEVVRVILERLSLSVRQSSLFALAVQVPRTRKGFQKLARLSLRPMRRRNQSHTHYAGTHK